MFFICNMSTQITPSAWPVVVTASDTDDIRAGRVSKGIFVGGAGNIAVLDGGGNAVTITGVVAGSILPIATKRVMSTNTTATNIVAFM